MWRITDFIVRIKSLINWFKVIWNDKQWDNWYYEKLLLHKITLQRKYIEKRGFFVGYENEIKWMKKCEYLLTMLVEYKYWLDEWDNKAPSENGLESKISYGIKVIDNNNMNKCYADVWEYKTRRLFWKIFVWRYERWWD